MDPEVNVSMKQKKIAFVQSEHIEAVITILRESAKSTQLVGDTEFATVVNAVTLDAQSNLIMEFINQIDKIKKGGLHK